MGKCYTFQVQSLENSLVPQSCLALCDPMGCNLPGSSVHGGSPGKNAGVGCHFLLWEIFLIQGLNLDPIAGRFFTSKPVGKPQDFAKMKTLMGYQEKQAFVF